MKRVFAAIFVAVLLISCAQDQISSLDAPKRFFAETKAGSSPDYGIIKWANPDDHVITVHGFMDDQASCKEVADALNFNACKELDGQNCPNPYSCIRLNQ